MRETICDREIGRERESERKTERLRDKDRERQRVRYFLLKSIFCAFNLLFRKLK